MLRVADATCLTVEFVPSLPCPPAADDAPSTSGSDVDTMQSSDASSSGSQSDSTSDSGPPAGPPPPRPVSGTGHGWQNYSAIVVGAACLVPAAACSNVSAQTHKPIRTPTFPSDTDVLVLTVIFLVFIGHVWYRLQAICHKLADDPSFGYGSHWLLGNLCAATRMLQTPHFALPRDLARLLQDEETDDGFDDLVPQEVAITFAVLAPEYAPEFVTLVLPLPCTWREAELLLPDARATIACLRFPHVRPLAQQPIQGFALLLAAPRWDPEATVVCLNSVAIDGRIFATYAPAYVDLEGLRWLAALPAGIDYDVFVDGDDQPLVRGPEIHLTQGMQIVYVEAGQVPAAGRALNQLLMSPVFWDDVQPFPAPALPDSYCIATAERHFLCSCDFGRPWRMKRHIASTIGMSHANFHVVPARPPIRDISVHGVKCRTLLAACSCDRSETNCRVFFLDLRPIKEGIKLRHCYGFALDLDLLIETLSAEAPRGWRAQATDAPTSFGGRVFLKPGAVITVDYLPDRSPVEAVAPDQHSSDNSAPSENFSSGAMTLDTQDSLTGQEAESGSVPLNTESNSDELDTAVSSDMRVRAFAILGQDYAAELIQIPLPPHPVSMTR